MSGNLRLEQDSLHVDVIKHDIESLTQILQHSLNYELVNLLIDDFFRENPDIMPQMVFQLDGLKLEIYANEHVPPHFHVKCKNPRINASFTINDCILITGSIQNKYKRTIEHWFNQEENKKLLIAVWNSTRPTNCLVGKI